MSFFAHWWAVLYLFNRFHIHFWNLLASYKNAMFSWEHISPCPIGGTSDPCPGPSLSAKSILFVRKLDVVLDPLRARADVMYGSPLMHPANACG